MQQQLTQISYSKEQKSKKKKIKKLIKLLKRLNRKNLLILSKEEQNNIEKYILNSEILYTAHNALKLLNNAKTNKCTMTQFGKYTSLSICIIGLIIGTGILFSTMQTIPVLIALSSCLASIPFGIASLCMGNKYKLEKAHNTIYLKTIQYNSMPNNQTQNLSYSLHTFFENYEMQKRNLEGLIANTSKICNNNTKSINEILKKFTSKYDLIEQIEQITKITDSNTLNHQI